MIALGQRAWEMRAATGKKWREIASALGENPNTVRRAGGAYRKLMKASAPVVVTPIAPIANGDADAARRALKDFLGTTFNAGDCRNDVLIPQARRRVCAIGDVHGAPHAGMVAAVIAEKPDVIVLGGDLLDAAQASSHPTLPGEKSADTIRQEMSRVRAMMETLLLYTPAQLMVLRGNHEDRLYKRAADVLPAYVLEWLQDPLELLVRDLPRTELVKTVWQWRSVGVGQRGDFAESRYMLSYGDALISHANMVGTASGDACKKLLTWVGKWRHTLDIDPQLYIQFHSHGKSLAYSDGGHVVLVEPGTACQPTADSYKVAYDLKWKASVVGGVAFEQVRRDGAWRTDLNSVRLLHPREAALAGAA